jgi:hypothetical protein
LGSIHARQHPRHRDPGAHRSLPERRHRSRVLDPLSIEALCTFENVDFRVRSASPALAIRLAKVVAEYRRQEMVALPGTLVGDPDDTTMRNVLRGREDGVAVR